MAGSSSKIILFVTYGGGHAQMVWPVVHALRRKPDVAEGSIRLHVLALPAARSILDAHDVENFSFADYLDPRLDQQALRHGEALARMHHSPASGIKYGDSVAYLGLSYQDLVIRHGEVEAARLLEQRGRRAFYPLTVMARIFDDLRPDFVVTTNSPRSEAAAIATANERGIGNLIMTDLFTGLGDYPLEARGITFLNRFARDMFVADGLVDERRSRAYFTGNPAFDRLLEMPRGPEAGWLERHFPDFGKRPVVLHADAPAYWDPDRQCSHFRSQSEILAELDAVWRAAMDNDALYLVRPHPSQDPGLYTDWIHGRRRARLARDNNLHDLLRNISLLVVRTSTVGLEAAYLGQRVLQLDSELHRDMPLAQMGVAWGSNGFEELGAAVSGALSDQAAFGRIRESIAELLPAEPAADKIAAILLDKLGRNPN